MSKNKDKDNILQFPNYGLQNPTISPESIQDKLLAYKESYSSELSEIIWQNVLGEMDRAGCDFDTDIEKYFSSMVLVYEAIKALHLLSLDVNHPLHQFAEENVMTEQTEPGVMQGGFGKDFDLGVDFDPEMD